MENLKIARVEIYKSKVIVLLSRHVSKLELIRHIMLCCFVFIGYTLSIFHYRCILLGCDYCETIRGVGPKKAFELITKHKSIENIVENLDSEVS
jgi:hypothetical protein